MLLGFLKFLNMSFPDLPYTFKFAIFASGFRSGSLVHKGFYDEEITLPSFHVYGEGDSIIPKGKFSVAF